MRRNIAIIGGKSLVGTYLTDLVATNDQCIAFTRQSLPDSQKHLDWKPLQDLLKNKVSGLDGVICVSHIWVVPEMIELFAQAGARKVVAISSTSKFTKAEFFVDKFHVKLRTKRFNFFIQLIEKFIFCGFNIHAIIINDQVIAFAIHRGRY